MPMAEMASRTDAAAPKGEGPKPDLQPPTMAVGIVGWARKNLFSTPANAILTLLALWFLYKTVPPLLDWLFISANWQEGTSRADCVKPGACWTMIRARFGQMMYGFYPEAERWRVNIAFLILIVGVAAVLIERVPYKIWTGAFLFLIYPFIAFLLFYGGLGLKPVDTSLWGGLMLTLIIAVTGIAVSLPVGVVLALGRRSAMPVIRIVTIAFIEFVRGVPLITVLFMASVIFPLFLPEGVKFDKLVRALVGISLFSSAYMAEVIRGGLQAIPKGQYEGAMSLGLNYWKMNAFIILPQALRICIPGIVNSFIGLFMDTNLVLIMGLIELLGIAQASTRDPNWLGLINTALAFVSLIYFAFCFGMSRYSQALERKLQKGVRR
jgi:general L-amino acid transport system permease protein